MKLFLTGWAAPLLQSTPELQSCPLATKYTGRCLTFLAEQEGEELNMHFQIIALIETRLANSSS
jgi:hypothetical protein